MSRTRVVDLNRYVPVSSKEKASLIIVPMRDSNEEKDELYFGYKDPYRELTTIPKSWKSSDRISRLIDKEEYDSLIDWWFENAIADDEYLNRYIEKFGDIEGINFNMSFDKCKTKLKSLHGTEGCKTNIHKFLWNWVRQQAKWQEKRNDKHRND